MFLLDSDGGQVRERKGSRALEGINLGVVSMGCWNFQDVWTGFRQTVCRELRRVSAITKAQHLFSENNKPAGRDTHPQCNHCHPGTSMHYLSWYYTPVHVLIYLWTGWGGIQMKHMTLVYYKAFFPCEKYTMSCFQNDHIWFLSLFHRLLYNTRMGPAYSALHCLFLLSLW